MLTAYVVDSIYDYVADDGQVTLREAITAANSNMAFSGLPAGDEAGDVIRFAPRLLGQTIEWEVGDITITDDLVISGNPAAPIMISADFDHRFFVIDSVEPVQISGLNLVAGDAGAGNGGAILLTRGPLILSSMRMIANDAQRGGAVFCAGDGDLQIIDSDFQLSKPLEGTVYAEPGSRIEIRGTTFLENGSKLGAAVFAEECEVLLDNCIFRANEGSYGGVIYGRNVDLIRVTNCEFVENRALRQGGAIYLTGGRMTIHGSVFVSNLAKENSGSSVGDGGALWLAQGSYTTLGDSRFTGNYAHRNGGVVFATSGATAGFHGILFENNQAHGQLEGNGGGVGYARQATLRWIQCTAIGNRADGALGAGGAVNSFQGTFNSRGSSYRQNTSHLLGGAIAAFGGFLRIENSLFGDQFSASKNLAGAGPFEEGYGGAIYVAHTDRFFVSGCNFVWSRAEQNGGAIYVADDATVRFTTAPSSMTDSFAGLHGGALYIAGRLVVEVPLTIARNKSIDYGGGIYSPTPFTIPPLISFQNNDPDDYAFGP